MKNLGLEMGEGLTTKEAAAALGLHPMTLVKQRAEGKGATYAKIGRKIMYFKKDLEAFIQANKVVSSAK